MGGRPSPRRAGAAELLLCFGPTPACRVSLSLGNLTLNQAGSGLTLFSAAQGTNHVATLKLF